MKHLFLLAIIFLSPITFAWNEDIETGNDSYYFKILDQSGHEFVGQASGYGDGNIRVMVRDPNGYIYPGSALNRDGYIYDLSTNMGAEE